MESLKLAVIGGGSSYTPELIEGVIKRIERLPVTRIDLVDVEAGKEKLDIITQLAQRMVARAGLNIEIRHTFNRREAIQGARFVMTQLRVGGLQARARDERIPLKYKVIGQETTGPGGFAKALRTIPVILDICKEMEELAPDAWLINFTNPAGMVTEAVQKYTSVKALGLCNVPINMHHQTAEALGASIDRVKVNFAGLNHLVWMSNIRLDGKDVTEQIIDKLCDGAQMNMNNIHESPWDPQFLKSLGVVPCPYHRYFYMQDDMLNEELESAASSGTRAEVVIKTEQELFKLYQDPDLAEKPEQLEQRGGAYYSDVSLNLVDALYNDTGAINVVNTMNKGAISNLPDDAVVEISSVIDSAGAHPLSQGRLPENQIGLASSVKAYEQLAIDAAVKGDYGMALQALVANPLIPSAKVAKLILNDILEQNADYLPQFQTT
ncbi:diacetylchitobiose-6-phosphate hydrolase [Endozoicomonas montiporae]|uniref:Diacetylchitobiose-6-phosphate hydrolase n=2 Tax=Endozoicomonas montiporae TaxID=1027273 RepID=A0A081N510_9GAMM|nr:6-phospho-beta-glucosidase [Endozoicomonas montiporae]AMO57596.1 6-phospho-beta-glucosidase [Endozoicomonas montiporae CL-33]KEQ13533.1 diacetylchitobiose-6-phosphate hydrolase [Endozoicomonas montiporae]